MAILLDGNMNVGEAGVKTRTKTCSMPEGFQLPHEYCRSTHGGVDLLASGQVLLPHQLCESSGGGCFSDGVIRRETSPREKTVALLHDFRGGNKSSIAGDEILMPHQLCEAIGVSRFPDGASKRPVSQKKDENLKLPHEFFGDTRCRIADEERQTRQRCESSVGGRRFSGGAIKRETTPKKEKNLTLPHELFGGTRSRIADEEIMLPHQLCESTGASKFPDDATKDGISSKNGDRCCDSHETYLKKFENPMLPNEFGRFDLRTTEGFALPSDQRQSRCNDGEKILSPHESMGNKIDVSDSAIKLTISNKNDEKLSLPHEICQPVPCSVSIEIKMPRGHYSQDMRLAMNLGGTAFEFSLCR
ncbi:hypothetical protein L1887_18012 [Cichorium endivia]|nr:hypothetical protein L1887_18012 [Cichorium endivia]